MTAVEFSKFYEKQLWKGGSGEDKTLEYMQTRDGSLAVEQFLKDDAKYGGKKSEDVQDFVVRHSVKLSTNMFGYHIVGCLIKTDRKFADAVVKELLTDGAQVFHFSTHKFAKFVLEAIIEQQPIYCEKIMQLLSTYQEDAIFRVCNNNYSNVSAPKSVITRTIYNAHFFEKLFWNYFFKFMTAPGMAVE